jgi:hypothetical protein
LLTCGWWLSGSGHTKQGFSEGRLSSNGRIGNAIDRQGFSDSWFGHDFVSSYRQTCTVLDASCRDASISMAGYPYSFSKLSRK